MPMAYQTLVGDMGTSLSGGQQQRVMIARALYRQPKILIMDEGTSHLDVDTERAINAALSQMPITRIVVAHRPETIRAAARVLQLSSNGLVEYPREVV
jgi:ATP-binding cassette subfamily B protein RaxB